MKVESRVWEVEGGGRATRDGIAKDKGYFGVLGEESGMLLVGEEIELGAVVIGNTKGLLEKLARREGKVDVGDSGVDVGGYPCTAK